MKLLKNCLHPRRKDSLLNSWPVARASSLESRVTDDERRSELCPSEMAVLAGNTHSSALVSTIASAIKAKFLVGLTTLIHTIGRAKSRLTGVKG